MGEGYHEMFCASTNHWLIQKGYLQNRISFNYRTFSSASVNIQNVSAAPKIQRVHMWGSSILPQTISRYEMTSRIHRRNRKMFPKN